MAWPDENVNERVSHVIPLRDVLVLVAVLILAISLRAIWAGHSQVHPVEGLDTFWYDAVAQSVSDGNGIANPEDGTTPTALFPPGYSLVLGGAYKLFGGGLWVAQALNIVFAAATVAITFWIGRLVFNQLVAGVAAVLLGVFPSQVIFSSLVMSELFFALLLTAVIALLLCASRAPRRQALILMVAAGLVAGAATLVRGQGLVLVPLVPVWWLMHHRARDQLLPVSLFLLMMTLSILPWTVRNWHQLDSLVVISTNMGWNAAIGHNASADGGHAAPGELFLDTLILPQPQREVKINENGVRLAWDYATSHPLREVELSAKKVYRLWKDDDAAVIWQEIKHEQYLGRKERRLLTHASNYFYFGALGLAVFGLVAGKPRLTEWRSLLVLLALGWTAAHIVGFGDDRLRYPLAPLLSLSAAAGLVATVQIPGLGSMVRRDWKTVASLLVIALCCAAWILVLVRVVL